MAPKNTSSKNAQTIQIVKPIEKYITSENFETHNKKFNTKAKIEIEGRIELNQYNMIIQSFNKVPEAMKLNVEILKIESEGKKIEQLGTWSNNTKTMRLITHDYCDQVSYDNTAFHETAHSFYMNYTKEQIKEWGEEVKELHLATEYVHHHYMEWMRAKERLCKCQLEIKRAKKKSRNSPDSIIVDAQNIIEMVTSDVNAKEQAYYNEMHSAAYSWKYTPDDGLNDQLDWGLLDELIAVFEWMFENPKTP